MAACLFAMGNAGTNILPLKLVYNGSASAPTGFYRVDQMPARRGDYVLIEPPEWLKNLIEVRRYLPPGIPLIKQIAATKGDLVCRWNNRIFINGVLAANAKTKGKNGWQLPRWQGCHQLQDHQIFVLQPHPESFDSRYFGIVDRSRIVGRATRLNLPIWQ
ncbi:S26 family signal peptidase [Roseibium sp. M-1]